MEFSLTAEQDALQTEWEEFYRKLTTDHPPIWQGGNVVDTTYGEGFQQGALAWLKRINNAENERGYLNLHWPKEWGGRGIGPIEQLILADIKSYYFVPNANWAGLKLLAPSLLEFGTEEQKREFLPKILRMDIIFCQAWSEPNAGSDLAALTTCATRDGDDYIVNGQKTWVSSTKLATWGHAPLRTDPDVKKRHRGLSYFMFPMNTPGITVKPIKNITERTEQAEVFFENVRIPAKYRIGAENQGWYVTMATANSERSGGAAGKIKRDIEELIAYCKRTTRGNGRPLIEDPFVKAGLADLTVDNQKLKAMVWNAAWRQSKGEDITMYASAGKIMTTELFHKMHNFIAHQVGGLYGQLRLGSPWAPFQGVFESHWESDLGAVINVGHNDIQHNLIAGYGLKMPRE